MADSDRAASLTALIEDLDAELSDARTTLDAIEDDVDPSDDATVDRAADLLAAVGDRLADLGDSVRADADAL